MNKINQPIYNMKIDRLHMLSQFVDIVTSHDKDEWTCQQLIEEAEKIHCYVGSEIATKIHDYNNFLKQPLTKDMFVNSCMHPDNMPVRWSCKEGNPFYQDHLNRWQEAEKKVIFKISDINFEWYRFNNTHIEIAKSQIGHFNLNIYSELIRCYTINDIAEATKGELEINLEI